MIPMLARPGSSLERAAGSLHLGFLTVLHEPGGYLGGYLVTNVWGRPIEFRLSTAVQPNRVQQILYAGTLAPYVCGDLIGKTLVEKSATPVQLVVTDCEAALDLRWKVDMPVAWFDPTKPGDGRRWAPHAQFPQDSGAIVELLDRLDSSFDLAEPFARVREAIAEARKLGVSNR